ncbi:hypothetical protein TNIN_164431 [Trichonephila inaurata madagascariensis]|uniref:Uncharacterized protein n=1 Tax=Trichonephila inaurata madagascariensis TaxID=2747483 RepID=A0A8X6WZX1_9ARAC|nr:hypothetical protein TNIN_164431 [Trichonephila inaurata madagascariensis]
MGKTPVYKRHKRFREGCINIEVDVRIGHPSYTTHENVECVRELVYADRRITTDVIVSEFGISHGSTPNDLKMNNIVSMCTYFQNCFTRKKGNESGYVQVFV